MKTSKTSKKSKKSKTTKKELSVKQVSQLLKLTEDEKNDTYFNRLKERMLTFKYMEEIAKRLHSIEDDSKFLYFAQQFLCLIDKHTEMQHKRNIENERLKLDKDKMKITKEHLALETLKIKALYSTEDEQKRKDIIKSLDDKINDFFGNPTKE